MNAADLTTSELVRRLRTWAEGDRPTTAAVELLIAHGTWLTRPELLDNTEVHQAYGMVEIHWDALVNRMNAGVPATASEVGVLRVACSLAPTSTVVDLNDVLLSCDQDNVRRIANAVLTAGGAR